MKKSLMVFVLAALAIGAMALPVFAVDPYQVLDNDPTPAPPGSPPSCPLVASLNGTCGNYRWFNLCAKYIWCYSGWGAGDGTGSLFGGGAQPAVAPGNRVKRSIMEFRGVVPNYGNTVDVYLDRDNNGDGTPDGVLGSSLAYDPAERWNCFDWNACIPAGVNYVITRAVHTGGAAPLFCTDGGNGPPFPDCNPSGSGPHSYYYPPSGPAIVWPGILHAYDNFRYAVAIDCATCVTSTEDATWGKVKGLYQ